VPPQPSPPAVEEIPVIESTMPDVAAITVASYFSPEQFAALRRLSELIAPAMNGAPGALEVETPEFLDFLLGESPADRQALYRTGLDELNSRAQQRFGLHLLYPSSGLRAGKRCVATEYGFRSRRAKRSTG